MTDGTDGDDLLEVRLLGPLQVRRRDGRLVDPRLWRTGMTADLLRLLALAEGRPVPVASLLEDLWPEVDEAHGRASLRTAASQLRLVLGRDAVEREAGGLALVRSWVDVAAYERLAQEAQRLLRAADPAAGVWTALEAEALCFGDVSAYQVDARWLQPVRARHQSVRARLLLAAADGALQLGWCADALDLAGAVLDQDPTDEPAVRALMRAHSRLGATSTALRVFERCRQVLADELGVDPSLQTRALHQELLADPHPQELVRTPTTPRRETSTLVQLLQQTRRTGAALTVHLVGETADERLCVVRDACSIEAVALETAQDVPTALAAAAGLDEARVLHVETGAAGELGLPATVPDGAVLVVLATDQAPRRPAGPVVELRPLLRRQLAELCEEVLGDVAGDALLAALAHRSGGIRSRAVRTLQDWLREGRVRASGAGMVLVDDPGGAGRTATRSSLARTMERLSDLDVEVLTTLAVLDRPTSRDPLLALLRVEADDGPHPFERPSGPALERSLGALADQGLVRTDDGRLVLRDALLGDGVRSWLRPSVLRRLHRVIAERAHISAADRVGHWLAVGEPELACAAALEAADAAAADGRDDDVRDSLLQVCALADVAVDTSGGADEVSERLADALRRLSQPEPAPAAAPGAAAPAQGGGTVRSLTAVTGTSSSPAPHRLEAGTGDGSHLRLAAPSERRGARRNTCLPPSSLPELLRPDGPAPELGGPLVELLLGNSRHAEHGLQRLRADLPVGTGPAVRACIDLLLRVAAHDLGRPQPQGGQELQHLAATAGPDWTWAAVRIQVERRELGAAAAADEAAGAATSQLSSQLALLARAGLAAAHGEAAASSSALRAVVPASLETGCTLLLPECAALLALAHAPRDPAAARESFDLFEWAAGALDVGPRAATLRLLARAALRAASGDHLRAAAAAAQAAHVAASHGLVPLAGQAHLARGRHLAAGRSPESVTAMTAARDAFRGAGIDLHGPLGSVSPIGLLTADG